MGNPQAERDPYRVLGVARDADADTIAAAHRALARRFHPDVSRLADADARMAEINTAWAILRDPARRALWDLANMPPGQRTPSPVLPTGATGSAAGDATRAGAGAGAAGWSGGPTGPVWRRGPFGEGAAGPPPGRPSGTVLPFGRHIGWSMGEVARVDPGYLAWLRERPEGALYRNEIDRILVAMRITRETATEAPARKRRFPLG
jgi:curved DNA-binding protein CbpA